MRFAPFARSFLFAGTSLLAFGATAHAQSVDQANAEAAVEAPAPAATGAADDEGADVTTTSSAIVVANVAPTGTLTGDEEGTEGGALNFSVAGHDAGANDTLSYLWTVTKGGNSYNLNGAADTASTFSFTPDDNAAYVVSVVVTEGQLVGTSLPLGRQGVLIGRGPECTLVLDDEFDWALEVGRLATRPATGGADGLGLLGSMAALTERRLSRDDVTVVVMDRRA